MHTTDARERRGNSTGKTAIPVGGAVKASGAYRANEAGGVDAADGANEAGAEWSIQHIAKLAGTTSRTLRHYAELGLVAPSRIGTNGYRYYDAAALRRLQRVLLLRELGLSLPQILQVLERQQSEEEALFVHLELLHEEHERLARRIAAVEHALHTITRKEAPVPEHIFDGFDHTQHRDEVEQRWGAQAYVRSDTWWRSMSGREREDWQARSAELGRDWAAAAQAPGADPRSPLAQELARRHVAWLSGIPGTPAADPEGDLAGYVRGLAEMYVADERFAANYGGIAGATFVRDALHACLDAN